MKKILVIVLIGGIAVTAFSSRNLFEKEHLALSANDNKVRWQKAKPAITQLKTGDLIFRHGRGFISNAFMTFGKQEQKYSHAGIVSIENGNAFVYHALGGEENASNKLRKDPLALFCNPADVHGFGIYRTDLSPEKIDSIELLAQKFYRDGLEFDTKFDLATNDKMYCTEFVYKVFDAVLGNQNYISLSTRTGKNYIACDDLYCNSHCQPVYTYNY